MSDEKPKLSAFEWLVLAISFAFVAHGVYGLLTN